MEGIKRHLLPLDAFEFREHQYVVTERSCVYVAKQAYFRRARLDTSAQIVEVLSSGHPQNHWYYRSDQWIEQPFLLLSIFMQPYVGRFEDCLFLSTIYSSDRYRVDLDLTRSFEKMLQKI